MQCNCYRCGEEREVAGYICKPCLDEVEEIEAGNESEHNSIITDAQSNGIVPYSPREAIIAMLDGATLVTATGIKIRYNKIEDTFVVADTNQPFYCFNGLYIQLERKKVPMNTFDCLAWVNSPESQGWMVRRKYIENEDWDDWNIPHHFDYDGQEEFSDPGCITYQRARLLPNKSGIDEKTIQGFLKEA